MALSSRQKIFVYFVGVGLGMLILAVFPKKPDSKEHPWHSQTAPDGYYPIQFIDDYGRELTFDSQPRWLVSLAPSITEMLFALGMGDHLLAVTEWDNYPEEARVLREGGGNIGRIDRPDVEGIIELRPQLVIASNLTELSIIERVHLPPATQAISLHHDSFDDVVQDVAALGKILGVPGKAVRLIGELERKRDAILSHVSSLESPPRRAVIMLGIEEGLTPGWSPGADTWAGNLIEMAHGKNVAAKLGSSWGQVSLEALIAENVDVIFIKDQRSEGARQRLRSDIDAMKKSRAWSQLDAVRNNRIIIVEDGPFTIPGPRMVDALEQVARGLWPEQFDQGEF